MAGGGAGTGAEDEVEACLLHIDTRTAELFGHSAPVGSQPLRTHLLTSFRDGAPGIAEALATAVRNGDSGAVVDHARELEGTAATVGAGALVTRVAAVQHSAGDGSDTIEVSDHLAGLEHPLEQVLARLAV